MPNKNLKSLKPWQTILGILIMVVLFLGVRVAIKSSQIGDQASPTPSSKSSQDYYAFHKDKIYKLAKDVDTMSIITQHQIQHNYSENVQRAALEVMGDITDLDSYQGNIPSKYSQTDQDLDNAKAYYMHLATNIGNYLGQFQNGDQSGINEYSDQIQKANALLNKAAGELAQARLDK